ncbi:hypothetical protein NG798_19480 [Ancylothrix sp. C2]|uniref:hypothetical protein n=1 Tax=Ancylothrix sp. D3o TaxID=2953691 RepID=UPI0021BAC5CF|nr:hypothetical protein [Ancylothrix sp. D3o]MCT7951984.1 hypothetical protein [Ancylothrix sp. D3o]
MANFYRSQPPGFCQPIYFWLLSLMLLTPATVFAHVGHGDEFKSGNSQTPGKQHIFMCRGSATLWYQPPHAATIPNPFLLLP